MNKSYILLYFSVFKKVFPITDKDLIINKHQYPGDLTNGCTDTNHSDGCKINDYCYNCNTQLETNLYNVLIYYEQ